MATERKKQKQKKEVLVSEIRRIDFLPAELTKSFEDPKICREGESPPKQTGQWLKMRICLDQPEIEVIDIRPTKPSKSPK